MRRALAQGFSLVKILFLRREAVVNAGLWRWTRAMLQATGRREVSRAQALFC